MNAPTTRQLETLLASFVRQCFSGTVPVARAHARDLDWVHLRLAQGRALSMREVSLWAGAKQRALYEVLRDRLVAMKRESLTHLPEGLLDASSGEVLGARVLDHLRAHEAKAAAAASGAGGSAA